MTGNKVLLGGFLCLFALCILAQVNPTKPVKQAKSKVYLLHSDVIKKSMDNPDPNARILVGNVEFRHDSVYMYCDSACFYQESNSFEAYDNVKMEQGDTLFLYGDYLFYDGNTKIAQVRNHVKMENRTTTLLTDSLNYDRMMNLGYYFDGGILMDEENVLTSDWGEYNPSTKQAVFNYNVKLENQKFTLTADTLHYNTETKTANIVGPTNIVSDKDHIYSEQGSYNTLTGQAILLDPSKITTDDGKQMTGDSLFYDREKAYGEAFNNIVYNDTVNKNQLTGNYGFFNDSTKFAYVTDNAQLIDYSQGDSLFLHADTLQMYTFNLNTDSMYREARAYFKVRFFRNDVQGVCDSLVFSSKDSCLTMYHEPVLWHEAQQLLGEEIHIYMNDSTIDWANIHNQALSVEQLDSVKYNQVSGKDINAYFTNGEMRQVDVIGSVRVIYYYQDKDSTYLGMDVSETSTLNLYLQDRKMKKIKMYPKPTGTFYPMGMIPDNKRKLESFAWYDYLRPRDKNDIMVWRYRLAGQGLKKTKHSAAPIPNQNLFKREEKNKENINKESKDVIKDKNVIVQENDIPLDDIKVDNGNKKSVNDKKQ